MRWLAIFVLTGFCHIASAHTELSDITELSLEELMSLDLVVTSAAKKPQKLAEAASAIYVLTNDDIRRSGATSLPELLRLVPGVQVSRITAHKWAVSIRGFNSQFSAKLLVLIDGRSIYSHLNAGVVWDIHNPMLEDIERIEVIRGPGASLWGANAMNGVINIITKEAGDSQGNLLVAGAGNEERVMTAFRHGGKISDKGHYRVYARYFDRDDGASIKGAETNDETQGVQAGFRTDFSISERDDLTLQGDFFQGDEMENLTAVSFPQQAIDTEAYQYNLLGRWQHSGLQGDEFSLQLYYNREQWNNNISSPALPDYHIDTFDVDFQHRFQVFEQHDITWGLGYRLIVDHFNNTPLIILDPDRRNSQLFSAFLQDEIILVPGFWRVILGSKFEENDYTGFEIQPTIRSIWNWGDQHALWAAISRATRTPSRTERDGLIRDGIAGTPLVFNFNNVRSNPLRSEELIAYELGYRFKVNDRLSFDLAAYFNDYKRLIDVHSTTLNFPVVTIENAYQGEATVMGLELAVDWRPMDDLSIRAHYSYLDDQSTVVQASMNEEAAPHHQAMIFAGYNITPEWELDLIGRYVDRIDLYNIDSYFNLDVQLAWRPVQGLEFAVVGQNLLDNEHAEFGEATLETTPTQVQRGIYGKLSWRF